jgi:hypothetical protein
VKEPSRQYASAATFRVALETRLKAMHLAQRAKTLEMAEDTPYRFLHLAIRCHFDAVGGVMANKSDWYFG